MMTIAIQEHQLVDDVDLIQTPLGLIKLRNIWRVGYTIPVKVDGITIYEYACEGYLVSIEANDIPVYKNVELPKVLITRVVDDEPRLPLPYDIVRVLCPEKLELVGGRQHPKGFWTEIEEEAFQTMRKLNQFYLYNFFPRHDIDPPSGDALPNKVYEKDDKIWIEIQGKTAPPLSKEKIPKLLALTDLEIVKLFRKRGITISLDDAVYIKERVKELSDREPPEGLVPLQRMFNVEIRKGVQIIPTIMSKQPTIWNVELYVGSVLKLKSRLEDYWWSKDRRFLSDVVNAINPQASDKQRKQILADTQQAFANFGKQIEKLSRETILALYSDQKTIRAPAVKIDLDEVYHHVGEKVVLTGRVTSIIKGVEPSGTGNYVKSLLFFIDKLEGSEANIPVSYVPLPNERDPDGIVEVEGTVEAYEVKKPQVPMMVLIRANKVSPIGLPIWGYTPTSTDLEAFKQHFGKINNDNAFEIIDTTVAPYVSGRSLEKMFCVLNWFSPMRLPLRGNAEFLLTLLLAGDSRTSKDLIAKDLVENLSPVGAVRINAEMAYKTGLVGACDRDQLTGSWIIRWGRLVQADRCGAVLQGISGFERDNLMQLREILAERKASIVKVVQGERQARSRLILTGNPRHEVKYYKTRLLAARDVGSGMNVLFSEDPDWFRIHVPIVFSEGDVALEVIDESVSRQNVQRTIPETIFKNKVADTWRREIGDYNVEKIMKIVPKVKEVLKTWRLMYKYVPLAIFRAEGIYILLSHVIAFATLRNSLDDQNRILPEESDVEFIKNLFEQLFKRLNLKVESQRITNEINMAKNIAVLLCSPQLDPYISKSVQRFRAILDALFGSGKPLTKEELGQKIGVSPITIWRDIYKVQEQANNSFPNAPSLVESISGAGIVLTEFGRMVARAVESIVKKK